MQGSEGNTNKIANEKIEEVIDAAVWINSFMLPVSNCFAICLSCALTGGQHDVEAFEIRQEAGYGARWMKTDAGWVFRGFVEPPMEAGHEKGTRCRNGHCQSADTRAGWKH